MTALLTVADALMQLRVSRRTLSDLTTQRRLGYVKLGRRLFFRQDDLDAFIESQHVAAVEPETAP